jgi:ketosteroid isomerase-like protein
VNLRDAQAQRAATAHLDFVSALSHGDLDRAAACFAKEGCLITPDLTAVHGRDRIRAVLAQLIASGAEVEVDAGHLVDAGEVFLARERWRIRTDRNGSRFERTCDTTLVMRLVEGRWKLVIAAPWGWGDGRV